MASSGKVDSKQSADNRFSDEADQQRALVEMQGVYCLSRPMRISHATAKNKANLGLSQSAMGSSSQGQPSPAQPSPAHPSPAFLSPPTASHGPSSQEPFLQTVPPRSVTTPVAQQQQQQQLQQAQQQAAQMAQQQQQQQQQQFLYQQQSMGYPPSIPGMDQDFSSQMYNYPDPNAQALEAVRALANAEGQPQASSTDPTNTTVFVGGLSSLISEETLKTFFVPFGEITYVSSFTCDADRRSKSLLGKVVALYNLYAKSMPSAP
jgi:RNA recognition motif-containing protein